MKTKNKKKKKSKNDKVMSTYVIRNYEIRVKTISGAIGYNTDIDQFNGEDGGYYTYYGTKANYRYLKYIENPSGKEKNMLNAHLQGIDSDAVPTVWKQIDLWAGIPPCDEWKETEDEDMYDATGRDGNSVKIRKVGEYVDNGGPIRDDFLSDSWDTYESGFADRGFPSDMSEELRAKIKHDTISEDGRDYTWGHTYVTAEEWMSLSGKVLSKFREELYGVLEEKRNGGIEEKLDLILKRLKDPMCEDIKVKKKRKGEDEDSSESRLEYLWNEKFYDYMSIENEISRAYAIADQYVTYVNPSDLRIIYYMG